MLDNMHKFVLILSKLVSYSPLDYVEIINLSSTKTLIHEQIRVNASSCIEVSSVGSVLFHYIQCYMHRSVLMESK